MSLYNGPARGGNRGGKDQFNWESVKSDKDREFYLGHSVKATTGRWQKGKDVFWYTREKQEEEAAKARLEMQAIKQREEDLMNEALGLKPKTIKQGGKPKLDSQDMAKLLGRTESEDQGQPDLLQDPDAVKGLGYAPNMMTGAQSAGRDVLAGIGVDGDNPAAAPPQSGSADVLPGPPPRPSQADSERMLKEQKKAVKKAKKEAKKAKRAAKREKKSKGKERLQTADLAETHRDRAAAASDSSMSSEPELPPNHIIHEAVDHKASRGRYSGDRHEHSNDRDRQDRSYDRDRHDRYHANGRHQADGRHQQHGRDSSVLPAGHRKDTRHSPEPERYRSRYSQDARHGQPDSTKYHSRQRHDYCSASPPRRRHRTRSPA